MDTPERYRYELKISCAGGTRCLDSDAWLVCTVRANIGYAVVRDCTTLCCFCVYWRQPLVCFFLRATHVIQNSLVICILFVILLSNCKCQKFPHYPGCQIRISFFYCIYLRSALQGLSYLLLSRMKGSPLPWSYSEVSSFHSVAYKHSHIPCCSMNHTMHHCMIIS